MQLEDEVRLKDAVDEAREELSRVCTLMDEAESKHNLAKERLDEWYSIYG